MEKIKNITDEEFLNWFKQEDKEISIDEVDFSKFPMKEFKPLRFLTL